MAPQIFLPAVHTGYYQNHRTTSYETFRNREFIVTHTFHPQYKKSFRALDYRHDFGNGYVYYENEKKQIKTIPIKWTDLVEIDPFLQISKGRSRIHFSHALELAKLVNSLKRET